jgi:putative membrane protein
MPRSLSPVSVPYRVLQRGGGIAIAFVFAMSGGFDIPGVGLAGPLALFAVAAVGALALIGYETAYVRRFSYDLGSDTLDIDSGVISQRSREIPIGRIQNVDISRRSRSSPSRPPAAATPRRVSGSSPSRRQSGSRPGLAD